jgi:hypothetical protein
MAWRRPRLGDERAADDFRNQVGRDRQELLVDGLQWRCRFSRA